MIQMRSVFALLSVLLTSVPAIAQTTAATTQPIAPSFKDSPTSPLVISSMVGVPFSYTIEARNIRGMPTSRISAFGATGLPGGLTVKSTSGVISGIPSQPGEFTIAISASNAAGTGSAQLKLTVYPEHPGTATTLMHLKGTTASPFGYVEFLPKNYYLKPTEKFPVVIDLCGAGNIARNPADPWGGNAQNKLWELTYQAGRTNRTGGTIFDDADCIILSPIPPNWWENVPLDQFLSYAGEHYRLDRSRIYLAGLSAGGDGVIDFVAAHGDQIAACVLGAISHDNPPRNHDWKPFTHIPTWIYENWKDPFDGGKGDLHQRHSVLLCRKITALLSGTPNPADPLNNYPLPDLTNTQPTADYTGVYTPIDGWKWSPGFNAEPGPPLRLTQFKTRGHGGWNQAYENPSLWRWLFAQHQSTATTQR